MKKTLAATLIILMSGCGTMSMEPVDLGLELEAFGGLFRVKPQVSIGDGKVGPTAVEVEFSKQEDTEEEESTSTDD